MPRVAKPEAAFEYRHLVLLASVLFYFFGMGGMFLLVVALKPLALDFGWNRSVPSLAFALQFIGSGIGGILMGYWTDRWGAGRPALLGAVMIGSGAIVAHYMRTEWELYLIYGVMLGFVGQSTLHTPLLANIMLWFTKRRGMAIGLVISGQSIAGMVWPPVFRHFNETQGWRETFFWYGILALLTMLPLSLILRRRPPIIGLEGPAGRPQPGPVARRLRASAVVLGRLSANQLQFWLCVAIVGCCISMSMPLGHIVAHTSDLGFGLARGAEMLSVILAGSLASRLVGGFFILDRLGGIKTLLLFSGLQAAGMGLYAMIGDLAGLYLVSFLFGVGYGGINMCYPSIIREYLPASEVGRRMGVITLFGATGMAIGAWTGGYLFDFTGGYAQAFLLGFGFNLANMIIVLSLLYAGRGRAELEPATA